MANKKRGLGRGLAALLADSEADYKAAAEGAVTMLRTADIEPNPRQARRRFDKAQLDELAASIREHGLLQPITVRPKGNGYYEIIAGERRWRACMAAHIAEVPVLIKDVTEQKASELSLVENLQREDLNPVEEAQGYKTLTESFGLTQEQAAARVGKSRAAVANSLRLLNLPDGVLRMVEEGALSYGHARSLLPLCGRFPEQRVEESAAYLVKSGISVRETERYVKLLLSGKPVKKPPSPVEDSYYRQLEGRVSEALGRRASIRNSARGGKLVLAYSGAEDLEALLKTLCGKDIFDDEM